VLTPAGGLLPALARACTLPVISVACEPTQAGMQWRGPRRVPSDWASVTVGSVSLSRRCPSCPFLPLLLHLGHPVVRFGRAFSCSLLAPRGGVAVPSRSRLRGGDEGRVRLSQLLQLYALCRELLAEL